MLKWQRTARWVIAFIGVSVVAVVALTVRERNVRVTQAPVPGLDPKATGETEGGDHKRWNRNKEEIDIDFRTRLSYADGTSKMMDIKVTTERAGGRIFVITGKEGQVGQDEQTVTLSGGVHVTTNDGLDLTTDRAIYNKSDSSARAEGRVDFSRERMKGSGVGFVYDSNNNVLNILNQARVDMVADEHGAGAMTVQSGSLEFRRSEHIMRFERSMTGTRGGHKIDADSAVAHLTEDEQHLQVLELRSNSRITAEKPKEGGLRSMNGRDIDLKYRDDGETLEHAVVNGAGTIQIAGTAQAAGREIAGESIDLALAPDGTTLTNLSAHERVRLTLPADQKNPARTITAVHLESTGDDQNGLTSARFLSNVEFSERGKDFTRTASSTTLDVKVGAGFSSVEEARFNQSVRFVDGDMTATAAIARYVVDGGFLELTGSEPASPVPHVVNKQIRLDAQRMDITLEGPAIKATGSVKSVLLPTTDPPSDGKPADRMPSMLKKDKPVNVTAQTLDYQGSASRAAYSGGVLLWQGETSIKAPTLTVDSRKGDMSADGQVTTVALLQQNGKDGQRESVRSTATAKSLQYEDATRRATYSGEAHLSGQAGDLVAPKIEMYMKPSGDELDRLEAYESATLRVNKRKTTAKRLTYRADDEQYLMRGTPVTTVDECGRETTGSVLTLDKATDRIVVDGNEQNPALTKGKSTCPGT